MSNKDTLMGRRPSDTYPGLMKLGSEYMTQSTGGDLDPIDAKLDLNARAVQDGNGNDTPIWLSLSKVWMHGLEFGKPTAMSNDGKKQILLYDTAVNATSISNRMRWGKVNELTSDDFSEGTTHQFWSTAKFDTAFRGMDTDDLPEGNKKYFSNTLARAAISTAAGKLSYNKSNGVLSVEQYFTADVTESPSHLYYSQARFNSAFADKSTDALKEGQTNRYFTVARSRTAISVTGGGVYNSDTGVITIPTTSAASSNLSGGSAQQIPYQATTGSTVFSTSLKWDNSVKTLLIGDNAAGSIRGQGGTNTASTFSIASGDSVAGSHLNLWAGDAQGANFKGGNVNIVAGSSTKNGGNVVIASGVGVTGGAVVIKTGIVASTEQLRILPTGAISIGSSGTSTGSVDQYLASAGPSTNPIWKTLPNRVEFSNVSDNLAAGKVGQVPYQSAVGKTTFSEMYWAPTGILQFKSPVTTLESKGPLTLTTTGGSTASSDILIKGGTSTALASGSVILSTSGSGTGGDVRIATASGDVLAVSNDGKLKLRGVSGTTNQVPVVNASGFTEYATLTSNLISESGKLFWTQARFNAAFALKTTSDLDEGTNLYYTPARFDAAFNAKTTTNLREGSNQYYTLARFNAALGTKTSDDIREGTTNGYFTSAKFDTAFAAKTTNNLLEGSANKYFTDTRFNTALSAKTTDDIREGTNKYFTDAKFNTAFATKTTTNLVEGTNQYFTNARARSAISVSGDLRYNSGTGVLSFSLPTGIQGNVPFISTSGTSQYTTSPLVTVGTFVENNEQLTYAQNQVAPQSTIINTWSRFSHAGAIQPAKPEEMLSWEYDAATQSIRNTTNSGSYVGLVSDVAYGDYDHEVLLTSQSADDDTIGVILAFAVVNGVEYTLSGVRGCGGNGRPWQVVYNYSQPGAFEIGATNVIKWSNGGVGADRTAAGYTGSPGWSLIPGGTRVKVTRRGDTITCVTTDMNSSTYVAGSTVTVDLTSRPELAKFMGKTKIGFAALSQQHSYWKQLSFVDHTPIYDLRDGSSWRNTTGTWVKSTAAATSLYNAVGVGRMIYDSLSQSLFFVEGQGKIVKMASGNASAPGAQIAVTSFAFTLAAGASRVFSVDETMNGKQSEFNLQSMTMGLTVLDGVTSSQTNGYYIPATAVSKYGTKDTGAAVVANISTTAQTFRLTVYATRK